GTSDVMAAESLAIIGLRSGNPELVTPQTTTHGRVTAGPRAITGFDDPQRADADILPAMPTSKTDVLVVGARPAGLTLACEILRHGLSVRVIEELEAPVIYSKAAVVHTRTMEVFDDMGVVGAILGRSKPVHGANVYAEGKRVAHIGFEGVDSPYPSSY